MHSFSSVADVMRQPSRNSGQLSIRILNADLPMQSAFPLFLFVVLCLRHAVAFATA